MQSHKKEQESKEGAPSLLSLQQIQELKEKAAQAEEKAEEFKDAAQRIQAEFENFAKRAAKEKEEFRRFASAEVIKDVLPVLDSFDGAVENFKRHDAQKETIEGIAMLKKQLLKALEKYGLKEIEAMGKHFDPHLHECYISEGLPGVKDNTVTQEIQKGYLLNSLVLRPSKVKINRLHENENKDG